MDTGGIEPRNRQRDLCSSCADQAEIAIDNADVIVLVVRHPHRRHRRRPGRGRSCSSARSKPVVLAVNKMRPRRPRRPGRLRVLQPGSGRPHRHLRRPRPWHRTSCWTPASSTFRRRGGGRGAGRRHQGGGHRQAQRGQVLPGQPHPGGGAGHRQQCGRHHPGRQWTATLRTSTASMSSSTPPACAKSPRWTTAVEKYSVLRATMAIERCDVCLILIDANEGRHRAGHQGGGSGPRGGQGLHHRGQQVGRHRKGRQDHGPDAGGRA